MYVHLFAQGHLTKSTGKVFQPPLISDVTSFTHQLLQVRILIISVLLKYYYFQKNRPPPMLAQPQASWVKLACASRMGS